MDPTTPTTPTAITLALPTTMTVDVRGTAVVLNLEAMSKTGALLNRAAYGLRKTLTDAHANAAFDTTEAMIRDKLWADVTLAADAKPADVKKVVVAQMPKAKEHATWETRVAATAVALATKAARALEAADWTGEEPFPIVLSGRDRALSDVLTARKIAHGATSADRAAFIAKVWKAYDEGVAKPAAMELCTEALNATSKPIPTADDLI